MYLSTDIQDEIQSMKFHSFKIDFIESLAGLHKRSANDLYSYHITRHVKGISVYYSIECK